jgi:hypothetical protein
MAHALFAAVKTALGLQIAMGAAVGFVINATPTPGAACCYYRAAWGCQ